METVWVITAEEVDGNKHYGPFVFSNRLSSHEMRKLAFWLTESYNLHCADGGSYDSGVYLIESPRFVFDSFDKMFNHLENLKN
jgi:hypothetical protein